MWNWILSFFENQTSEIKTKTQEKEFIYKKIGNCANCNGTGLVQFSDKPGTRKITTFCKCRLQN